MPIQNADVVAKNIVAFGGAFRSEVDKDMEAVREVLDSTVDRNISLTDHSQRDLDLMGHPYATRAPQAIHDPRYQVHEQTGKLRGSKFSGTDKAAVIGGSLNARAYVGVKAEHAKYVVYGTSKMVPRDFLMGSLGEVREKAFRILRTSLRGAVINFGGQQVKL